MTSVLSAGAILLAGGRGSRVDGATKPLFEMGGRTLLRRAVDAVRDAGAHPIAVAAPVLDAALRVDWVREDPPFGGPVAGAVAALDMWAASGIAPTWTFLLACDLPGAEAAVTRLSADLALLPQDSDGLCLGDGGSRPQWLTGVYRTRALQEAAAALPDRGRNAPVRALTADLAITVVRAPDAETLDVDTWEDLEVARRRAEEDS
ncbi:MAG: NTP transferase domain-containing protein [Microbacterium sp.]